MSYQLNCPNCGKRAVSEFTFRSEYLKRPAQMPIFQSGQIMFISEKITWGTKQNGGINGADVKAGF